MDKELTIQEYLDRDERKDLLRLLTAGSVDDGKSTLIGRLLFDCKKIYEDQLSALERDSRRQGNAGNHMDYALLCDGLKAEREQGITIDVAYRYFSTNKRKFIIADTPGHEQYTRNMITGGSTAQLAIILVDARTGIITQTRRHSFLVSLLGIKHIVLAVNKMDLVDFSQARFNEIVTDYAHLTTALNLTDVTAIPLSALEGDNVVTTSDHTPWYNGPSLLDYLESVDVKEDINIDLFRYPVQYVLRPHQDFRGFCGTIASGIIRRGDDVIALPSRKRSKVKRIVTYDGDLEMAFAPQSVTLTLTDEIDISRGNMLIRADQLPLQGQHFLAMMVWMDETPMDFSKAYFVKQTTQTCRAFIKAIRYKVDVNTMKQVSTEDLQIDLHEETMRLNQIALIELTTAQPLFVDPYAQNHATGSFILMDPISNQTSAVGIIQGTVESDEEESCSTDIDAVLDLPQLGIDSKHYEVVEKIVKSLEEQGIRIKINKGMC